MTHVLTTALITGLLVVLVVLLISGVAELALPEIAIAAFLVVCRNIHCYAKRARGR